MKKISSIKINGKEVDIKLFIKKTGLKEQTLIQLAESGVEVRSWNGEITEIEISNE